MNPGNSVFLLMLYYWFAKVQPDDVTGVLAGPLKRRFRLAGLICIVHPTGCKVCNTVSENIILQRLPMVICMKTRCQTPKTDHNDPTAPVKNNRMLLSLT